jgi:hypothetical protein
MDGFPMTDVFPFPLPTTHVVPTEHAARRDGSPFASTSTIDLLLTNDVICFCAKWRMGVWSLDAILEFPCFRFAVYEHLYPMADWVAELLRAAFLKARHHFQ